MKKAEKTFLDFYQELYFYCCYGDNRPIGYNINQFNLMEECKVSLHYVAECERPRIVQNYASKIFALEV